MIIIAVSLYFEHVIMMSKRPWYYYAGDYHPALRGNSQAAVTIVGAAAGVPRVSKRLQQDYPTNRYWTG